jgi:ABC-type lipoprotein export system ATPase subunit
MNLGILAIKQIEKFFVIGNTKINILHNLSASFEQGASYAITGVSGTGKSTLMHILAGLDEPSSGHVLFNGNDLAAFTCAERSLFLNQSIGLVFQAPYLIRELTVLENIMMPGIIAGFSEQQCSERAKELLDQMQLSQKKYDKIATLSGGQQQRVALARALFNKPAFLLADEPTGNLDMQTGKLMVELLRTCHKKYNMGIIVSTHDAYVASSMAYTYELKDGTLKLI